MGQRSTLTISGEPALDPFVIDWSRPGGFVIGRDGEADLFLNDPAISRRHSRIYLRNGSPFIENISEQAQSHVNGQVISGAHALHDGDVIGIGRIALLFNADRSVQAHPTHEEASSPVAQAAGQAAASIEPEQVIGKTMVSARQRPTGGLEALTIPLGRDAVLIGRDPACTVSVADLMISRVHAKVQPLTAGYAIEDLASTNGTFVNGKRIDTATPLAVGDAVGIGPYEFAFDGTCLTSRFEEKGAHIQVSELSKKVISRDTGEPLWLLSNVTLTIRPGEFVGLMGASGCGKSTFMDAINGRRPATHGAVYHDKEDLYQRFESIKSRIGYVPQQVIFHRQLPIGRALHYSSLLRLSKDASKKEIAGNIDRVLETVGLLERRNTRFKDLSGGQQKRVSIAMELLSKPRTLFLDEVTSGLDLGSEKLMMQLFRELVDAGMTLICITHFVESLDICDQVAYFNKGRLCFYGPPAAMKKHFGIHNFAEIYALETTKEPEVWEKEFHQSAEYETYVRSAALESALTGPPARVQSPRVEPAAGEGGKGRAGTFAKVFMGAPERVLNLIKQPSDFKRQYRVLTMRYTRLVLADRLNLLILLGLAPVVAVLLCLLSHSFDAPPQVIATPRGVAQLTQNEEYVGQQTTLCFGAIVTLFFLGLFAAVREIVKELDIYRHERFVNLQIVPYVLSKVTVLAIINLIQVALIMAILDRYGLWSVGSHVQRFVILYPTAMAGTLMGLTLSAAASNSEWAVNLMIGVVIPQTLFAGAFFAVSGASAFIAKGFVVSYWSMEAFKAHFPEVKTVTAQAGIERPDTWVWALLVVVLHCAVYVWLCLGFMANKDGPGLLAKLARPLLERALRSS